MSARNGLWIATAAGVALLAGFAAGRWLPGGAGPASLEPPGPASIVAAADRRDPAAALQMPDDAAPVEEQPSLPSEALLPEPPPPGHDGVIALMRLRGDFAQTAGLYALAGRADAAALRRYIDEARGIGIEDERNAALAILFMRFSELDPEQSIEHLYRTGLATRPNIVFAMFNGWAKYELDAAVARVDLLRGPAEKRVASDAILQAHVDAEPDFVERLGARLPAASPYPAPRALARRARSDPGGALTAALALADVDVRAQALYGIAGTLVRIDAGSALAQAEAITNPALRREFRALVLRQLAEHAPEIALAMLDTSPPHEREIIVQAAMSVLARSDPERALAIAADLADGQERMHALTMLLSTWAQHDPRAAAAALAEWPDLHARPRFGYSVVHRLARLAPLEAMAWAERLEGRRGDLWRTALGAIAQYDPAQALAIAVELESSPLKVEAITSILNTMAASDPLLAAEFIDQVPAGPHRLHVIGQIASNWAQRDPGAALDWLLTQPLGAQLSGLPSLVHAATSRDVRQAAAYAERVPPAALSDWISAVVHPYAELDTAEAAAWIARYRELPGYGRWLGVVAAAYAPREPRTGARLIARVTDPEVYRPAQLHFAQRWAETDPEAVVRWWSRLPSERRDPSIVSVVASLWQRVDPAAAERWVLRLAAGEYRDAGIQTLISGGHMELNEVERWIRRLDSPQQREQAYMMQVRQLAGYDPDAARELIRRAAVDDAARARLEQVLAQNRPGG